MMSRKFDAGCTGIYPTLAATDLMATIDFYREKLDFDLRFLWGEPPTHGAVWLGEATVHFFTGRPNPGGSWMYFQIENIDDLYARYRSNGVTCLDEPQDQPWGMREFNIHDLDGYHLRFGQPDFKFGDPVPIARVDLTIRLETRLAALLGDLAEHKGMALNEMLEETLLHSFQTEQGQEGKTVASPHTKRTMAYIDQLKRQHGIDYDNHASYRFTEAKTKSD
jgi:catechol 2,3-dioxygenase-like lactoylglutathione lyase family enzyme